MLWCSLLARLKSDARMGLDSPVPGGCHLSPWPAFQLRGTCQTLPDLGDAGAWPQPWALLGSAALRWFGGRQETQGVWRLRNGSDPDIAWSCCVV